jgi:hypothetical protein
MGLCTREGTLCSTRPRQRCFGIDLVFPVLTVLLRVRSKGPPEDLRLFLKPLSSVPNHYETVTVWPRLSNLLRRHQKLLSDASRCRTWPVASGVHEPMSRYPTMWAYSARKWTADLR